MEFHGSVICTTGHENIPTIPCLDFTPSFANNGRLFARGTNMEAPTPATNGRDRRANLQHTTELRPAAYRFQVRSSRRCIPGSDVGPDMPGPMRKRTALAWRTVAGFGFGTGKLPVGTPLRGPRAIRPAGPSPRRPGRRTLLRHGRPCPPGPCGRSRPRPASGRG